MHNELIEEYLRYFQHNKGRAERSVVKYRQQLERLGEFLKQKDIGLLEADQDLLDEYVGIYAHQVLKLTPRARRPLVAAVRGFYKWLARSRRLSANPAEFVDYPKVGRRLPRTMSLQNAERLLMRCDLETFVGVRDAAIIGLLIGCGPRISGVCRLNEEDLLWHSEKNHMRLVVRFKEKGDKERLVPAPVESSMLIQAYLGHVDLDGIDRTTESGDRVLFVSTANRNVLPHEYHGEKRRLSARSVNNRIEGYGLEVGIPADELHPHALRHLFGTEMVESDVNILVHQDLMGHEDPKTTEGYTQLAIRKKTEAIDRASPMGKIKTPVTEIVRSITR